MLYTTVASLNTATSKRFAIQLRESVLDVALHMDSLNAYTALAVQTRWPVHHHHHKAVCLSVFIIMSSYSGASPPPNIHIKCKDRATGALAVSHRPLERESSMYRELGLAEQVSTP